MHHLLEWCLLQMKYIYSKKYVHELYRILYLATYLPS